MKRKINVVYFDESHVFSGAENSLSLLVNALDRDSFEPSLCFVYPQSHQDRFSSLNIPIDFLVARPTWWMGSEYWERPIRGSDFISRIVLAGRLANRLRKRNIDILHINLCKPTSFWFVCIPKLLGIKVVLHCRSDSISWIPGRRIQWVCDSIISVSNFVQIKVLSKNRHSTVKTIYNPINFISDGLDESEKYHARQRLGFSKDACLISSVGLLSPHKGHEMAIKVLSSLTNEFKDIELVVVGGGDEGELKRLIDIAKQLGVYDRVFFTRGQVTDVVDYYLASDLVLSLTTRGEAFGRVPFEAISLGTPVLAPNMGGASELISDGETGFLVDTLSEDAVLEKCLMILRDPIRARSVIERGRRDLSCRLSVEKAASAVSEVYQSIL